MLSSVEIFDFLIHFCLPFADTLTFMFSKILRSHLKSNFVDKHINVKVTKKTLMIFMFKIKKYFALLILKLIH